MASTLVPDLMDIDDWVQRGAAPDTTSSYPEPMDIDDPDPNWPKRRKPRKSKPFPLLELPAKVRTRVYQIALVQNHASMVVETCEEEHDLLGRTTKAFAKTRFPPLLQTCRTIRREASKIWYSSATIHFLKVEKLCKFWDIADPEYKSKLPTMRSASMMRDICRPQSTTYS